MKCVALFVFAFAVAVECAPVLTPWSWWPGYYPKPVHAQSPYYYYHMHPKPEPPKAENPGLGYMDGEKYVFYGSLANGTCENALDGVYYIDNSNFAFCSNGAISQQPCAAGAENPVLESFKPGYHYTAVDFCSVNALARDAVAEAAPTHAPREMPAAPTHAPKEMPAAPTHAPKEMPTGPTHTLQETIKGQDNDMSEEMGADGANEIVDDDNADDVM